MFIFLSKLIGAVFEGIKSTIFTNRKWDVIKQELDYLHRERMEQYKLFVMLLNRLTLSGEKSLSDEREVEK